MKVVILDGFKNWTPLMEISPSKLPENKAGVYVFTHNEAIEYPKGFSEVLYIGRTDNFRRRLFGNYIGGVGGKTTKRIHEYLFNQGFIHKINVGFKICEDYKREEQKLRKVFREIFGNNPLWNLI